MKDDNLSKDVIWANNLITLASKRRESVCWGASLSAAGREREVGEEEMVEEDLYLRARMNGI